MLLEHLCTAHPVFSKFTEEEQKAPIVTLLKKELNYSELENINKELGYIETDPDMRQACFDSLSKVQKKELIDQIPESHLETLLNDSSFKPDNLEDKNIAELGEDDKKAQMDELKKRLHVEVDNENQLKLTKLDP